MSFKHSEWIKNPKIYEINTWPWLKSLSDRYNFPITLNNIPNEIYNKDLSLFDTVWFMGVWERSPASRKIALEHPDLQNGFHNALHELRDDDVVGSPYSIYYYHVDKHLGGIDGLKEARDRLDERGIRLILDYVPNHVSIDSLWTFESNLFIEGTLEDLMNRPYDFFSLSEKIYAHGRDPNFSGWTDTIQINAFSEEAREKIINTLLGIAELCDGVRCDMAMLMTNSIFSKTWGEKAGTIPKKEFWEEVIPAVKKVFPHFIFIAEVYWDMEWELQAQGFDFCYDKRLYERLIEGNVESIKAHLNTGGDYQSKLVRFIENHDEDRASNVFGGNKNRAAALIAMTLPGAKLLHEGQMKGYKIDLPIQLGRRDSEKEDEDLLNFYQQLLKIIPGKDFENRNWTLCKIEPIGINDNSYKNLISYLWWNDVDCMLIVVNYSSIPSKAHIRIEQINYESNDWAFTDLLTGKKYIYKGEDLNEFGLYVDLTEWSGHIFKIKKN
ncbi:MAG: alpha-amylase family glycosyl hydrolase [Promethearchaeota archaeon]|jgi:glycosidase